MEQGYRQALMDWCFEVASHKLGGNVDRLAERSWQRNQAIVARGMKPEQVPLPITEER